MSNELFRTIPAIDAILNQAGLNALDCSPSIKKIAVNEEVGRIRKLLAEGKLSASPDAGAIAARACGIIETSMHPALRRVINSAGVVVYTNMGRAPLAAEAIEAINEVSRGYSNLEYNLDKGARGSRQDHIRALTRYAFGAQDALVVNNNAAAVLLVLSTLARSGEVIVSRGELVEIGGAFRMPDVMDMSGAILREVGTTNKTRIEDYDRAITDDTALIMKVHRSNFALTGFTGEASIEELAKLGKKRGIPVYIDMGSGIPFSLDECGVKDEWTIPACLDSSDVVSFSGDKVLGGPQAGIILGRHDLVEAMAVNPLHRALRVDKLTIAAMSATLALISGEKYTHVPVLRMIREPLSEVEKRSRMLASMLESVETEVVSTLAVIGGGAAPAKTFPSSGVEIRTPFAEKIHRSLRKGSPAVVSRIEENRLVFDMKAVSELEIGELAERIRGALWEDVQK